MINLFSSFINAKLLVISPLLLPLRENVVKLEREKAVEHLKAQVQNLCNEDLEFSFNEAVHEISNTYFGIHPFYIKKGKK